MIQTANVVIIGGGIVGSSVAYHLTAAGCGDVLVIERESHQGKGSTGKSMGGVRSTDASIAASPILTGRTFSLSATPGPCRLGTPDRDLPATSFKAGSSAASRYLKADWRLLPN